jgi:peptide deformylase
MILEILQSSDPRLRKKSKKVKKVDKKIKILIEDMKKTLIAQKDPEGVGLAAPQVGKNIRLFLIKPDKEITVIINPKIISVSKSNLKNTKILEGCLSLPNFYGPLKRSRNITISYLDEDEKQKTQEYKGFMAQIIGHEMDHLNGILFVDRLLEQNKPLYELKNGEWERVEI